MNVLQIQRGPVVGPGRIANRRRRLNQFTAPPADPHAAEIERALGALTAIVADTELARAARLVAARAHRSLHRYRAPAVVVAMEARMGLRP